MSLAWLALLQAASGGPLLVDGFERLDPWSAHPADGVELRLVSDQGRSGRALRMDFSFTAGGGYAIARRRAAIPLPANYAWSFWIRGDARPNTLEFKLVDRSGENVWWYTERDRVFDGSWQRITIRKRQIAFAWGPRGGGTLDTVAAIELVVTAGQGGGAGRIWVDDLTLTPAPDLGPYDLTPRVTASGSRTGHPPSALLDGDTTTSWLPAGRRPLVTVDFLRPREYGGVTLVWTGGRDPPGLVVRISDDGRRWSEVARRRPGPRNRDYLYLPDTESRYLRLELAGTGGAGLGELRIEPLEWSATRNAFFGAIAAEAPRGAYPRYFLGQRADWTVVGADGAAEEALINEDGAIESGSGGFSAEPFFRSDDGRLYTWHDVRTRLSLEESRLPIPSVEWRAGPLALTITAFAIGGDRGSSVVGRYRIANTGPTRLRGTFFLAIRPFQVNPPWQFLGTPGGVTRIDSLRWDGRRLLLDADRTVIPLLPPAGFGGLAFEAGDIVSHVRRGVLPRAVVVRDRFGAASGALAWPVAIEPGDSTTIAVEIPLEGGSAGRIGQDGVAGVDAALARVKAEWRATVDRATIGLPSAGRHVEHSIASSIAYVLVNRDGPALQPGSRSYQRSWIRDGALTGAALLRFGHAEVVREFILWYAEFQYSSGKIPCCVDRRGPDPVPEHDSNGEFIHIVAEYFRHTGDRALLQRLWPRIDRAVGYLDSLRHTRRTPEYRTAEGRVFFGLLPPSISHEGYSAKPMHSYWDDFFALRGFKDAVALAGTLGRPDDARRIAAIRDEFAGDLYASIAEAMRRHRIDFIPGAADLGDFDATSTTIAVTPGGELDRLPAAALERTFERYWSEAMARRDTSTRWEAYTPYELRSVGTLVRMDRADRAHRLLEGFMADQYPVAWNQWPEVVWREPRAARFLGDLPHTWVASDFLRSVADMFVYEREADSALVVAAGIPESWLDENGVRVRRLSTWWGPLSYSARRSDAAVVVTIEAGIRIPPGGILVRPPGTGFTPSGATVDGRPATLGAGGAVLLRAAPATIRFLR